jgi:small subunit ribosomal protein S1
VSDSTEDFASLFEASFKARRIEKGQTLEGTIVAFGDEVAFVDVGGKGEATIDLAELRDDQGNIEVAVGDRVHAMVVSTAGGIVLSRRLARGAATDRQLDDAFQTGLPVEGRVERAVKGGYEVRIGRHRAFCPASQIDLTRSDPAAHDGRVYQFRIIEFKDGGRNLVVSRRALLEDEQRASAAEVRKSIVPGAVLPGTIASVREFGAFVDLGGGVQGLLHVSEMGWSRVSDVASLFTAGDPVTVKVLRVDDENGRIALTLKQLTADPWSAAAARYNVGQVVTGRVTRVADFGAFVEIEPGVEALAHVSTFAPTGGRGGSRTGGLVPGMTASFEILSVDLDKKRIGVAPVSEGTAQAGGAAAAQGAIVPGARLVGTVERHEPFGVFVFLAPGRTGLIPMSETGVARGADVARALPVGSEVEVIVLEADSSGRRIRLSAKAVEDAREAAEVREYTERADALPSAGFGSLADKLRGALQPPKKT